MRYRQKNFLDISTDLTLHPGTNGGGVLRIMSPVYQASHRQPGRQFQLADSLNDEIRHGVHHIEVLCSSQ